MGWLLHLIWPAIVVAIVSIAVVEHRRYRGRQLSAINLLPYRESASRSRGQVAN